MVFLVQISGFFFFFFSRNFEIRQISGYWLLISNMTLIFINFDPKIPKIRHFWFQKFCFFAKFDKFEGADFIYDISFWKSYQWKTQIRNIRFQRFDFLPKNFQNKAFWFANLGIFFREILQLDKFECSYFKYDNTFLKF